MNSLRDVASSAGPPVGLGTGLAIRERGVLGAMPIPGCVRDSGRETGRHQLPPRIVAGEARHPADRRCDLQDRDAPRVADHSEHILSAPGFSQASAAPEPLAPLFGVGLPSSHRQLRGRTSRSPPPPLHNPRSVILFRPKAIRSGGKRCSSALCWLDDFPYGCEQKNRRSGKLPATPEQRRGPGRNGRPRWRKPGIFSGDDSARNCSIHPTTRASPRPPNSCRSVHTERLFIIPYAGRPSMGRCMFKE